MPRCGRFLSWYYYSLCSSSSSTKRFWSTSLSQSSWRVPRASYRSTRTIATTNTPSTSSNTQLGADRYWIMNEDDAPPLDGGDDQAEWTVCTVCDGQGKILKPPTRKARLRHKRARQENSNNDHDTTVPPLLGRWEPCTSCVSQGLVEVASATTTPSSSPATVPRFEKPRIAVIGGGLAGLALATAARHRGLSCTVYERDQHFAQRQQGYGLTMQQASKALRRLGILTLRGGITSTKHVVHQQDGKVVAEWGLKKWGRPEGKKDPKRQNVHIARQALRYHLWQTAGKDHICWNHRLLEFVEHEHGITLRFKVGEKAVTAEADILIGADGIRSQVRQQLIGEEKAPLRYLDCIVILGICPLEGLPESPLLDGETVFQTADGITRIYMMPYSTTEYSEFQQGFCWGRNICTNIFLTFLMVLQCGN